MSSEIITSAIGAVIGNEITKGFKKVIDETKDNPQLVIVKSKPTKFTKSRLIRVSSVTTRTDSPQGTILNPVDEDVTIKNISILPDSSFKTGGRLEIKVNEVEVFQDNAVGDFSDVQILDLDLNPEGKLLLRGKSIDVFAWGSGSVTLFVLFDRAGVD